MFKNIYLVIILLIIYQNLLMIQLLFLVNFDYYSIIINLIQIYGSLILKIFLQGELNNAI